MTNNSGERAPMTPEAKLADRNWRWKNSWWIFPPLLSLTFLCWLGFLVAAIRTGERKYWVFTGVYTTAWVLFIVLANISEGDENGLANGLAIALLLICWIGATVHAAILNRGYLRTLAEKGAWYQAPATTTTDYAGPNAAHQPPSFLGVSTEPYYAQAPSATPNSAPTPTASAYPPPPPQPVASHQANVPPPAPQGTPNGVPANSATTDDLARIPGITPALAQRIVAIRDARGGYRDIHDLAAAANLQPHEVVRLRSNLTFGDATHSQSQHNPSQRGPTGRILDI